MGNPGGLPLSGGWCALRVLSPIEMDTDLSTAATLEVGRTESCLLLSGPVTPLGLRDSPRLPGWGPWGVTWVGTLC